VSPSRVGREWLRRPRKRGRIAPSTEGPDIASSDGVQALPPVPGVVPAGAHQRRAETLSILAHHDEDPRFLNRELSWLQFNERVLAIAEDADLPLLERLKFVAIFTSNLDEFFQVRVAGLREQLAANATGLNADGLTPAAQLAAIDEMVRQLSRRQGELVRDELTPALRAAGIAIVDFEDLTRPERSQLDAEFEDLVFPVLTPLAVDPAHPFPYISNLSLNLAVRLRDGGGGLRFARVKIPPVLPRFMALTSRPGEHRFVMLESLIAARLDRLFPGVEVLDHHLFRVTRNADFEIEEAEADDLLLAIESELSRRRFGRAVRLEVETDMPDATRALLVRELGIEQSEVHVVPSPLGLSAFMELTGLDLPTLRLPNHTPFTNPELTTGPGEDVDLFAVLRDRDVLVHHPYDAFATSVQRFIEQAAEDPDVLAIKITLYRTSGPGSPIIRALLDAAEAGKQVVVLVELKARFDEETNIGWARALEEAGVHVAYGVVGLKTHTKIALVVRREGDAVRRYVHVGTGNYNDVTARIYEDLGLLTSDAELGADLSDLFNVLTGYARQPRYRRLVVAPEEFRPRITELIAREAAADDGHIVIKANAVVDPDIVDALYDASQQGTRIELLVRGICALRPGVPGRSENITVRSIVGRYLEHSRIYRFGSEERGIERLIGSGDLMPRNLDRRVEALTPVRDPRLAQRLDEILDVLRSDDLLAWELGPDTVWRRTAPIVGIDAQATLQDRAGRRSERPTLRA
jgi:polyphosphate kinase